MNINSVVEAQRKYFESGATRSTEFRIEMLKKLRQSILDNGRAIAGALMYDLNKQPYETYMCETGLVLEEIGYHIKHLAGWDRVRRVPGSLAQLPGSGRICPEPYGVVLIMAPWNYPVQLCLMPLIGAISAGNCAVIKPSAYAAESSHVIRKIISDAFPPEYISVIEGGRAENQALLEEKFDYIFFTGSPKVGHLVMEEASKNLTPVTLELGGKSPVIVDETANIARAARRIAFGKVLNAGQTCVEPDYLLIQRGVRDRFIEEYKKALKSFFPRGDMSMMVHIINDKHFERLTAVLASGTAVIGGGSDKASRFIEPTVLVDVPLDSPAMQEEIFGPVLPVLCYDEIDECISFIRSRPRPLALYMFSEDRTAQDRVLNACSFGGGCINDTILHLASSNMSFGGVGNSGMGSYHGKKSYETFTHFRSVLRQPTAVDVPLRYLPYNAVKEKLLKILLK